MKNPVRVNKHHVPVEHVVLFEPFVANPDAPLFSTRTFETRIMLLNRDSILTEQTVDELARLHGFRHLAADGVAINPSVFFRVETFAPAEGFRPSKPFQSRLVWRDRDGNTQSKLLVAGPDAVLAVIVDGPVAGEETDGAEGAVQRPKARRRARRAPSRTPA